MTSRPLDRLAVVLPASRKPLQRFWNEGHPLGFSRHRHRPAVVSNLPWFLAGFAAGALLGYYLDPDRGARRRGITRDRCRSMFRRTGYGFGRLGRKLSSDAYGWSQKAMHPGFTQDAPANDEALARKVETELFRSRDVPKGRLNVNAQEGIVVLRGELDRPEEIRELVEAAGRVPGVRAVENLLHLPNTAAPSRTRAGPDGLTG
jgi:BON domain